MNTSMYIIGFVVVNRPRYAGVAELADALDLGSSGRPCRFDSCYPQYIKKVDLKIKEA